MAGAALAKGDAAPFGRLVDLARMLLSRIALVVSMQPY